ncbi:hypothetical protein [Leifsonia sp. NPDC080035]|uniref:Lipoprotein n=1 Tax=Leifsonia sp. NPDC080035 TaxID=3143936 RepID=A0AAU7GCE9_9MICO
MPRRPLLAAATVAVLAVGLSGCAPAPAHHSDAEIERWMDAHSEGSLGGGGGRGSEGDVRANPGGTISFDLHTRSTVTGATLWCLGPGTAHVTITARTTAGSTTSPGDVRCADGARPLDLDGMVLGGVVEVVVTDIDLSGADAWYIAIDGHDVTA